MMKKTLFASLLISGFVVAPIEMPASTLDSDFLFKKRKSRFDEGSDKAPNPDDLPWHVKSVLKRMWGEEWKEEYESFVKKNKGNWKRGLKELADEWRERNGDKSEEDLEDSLEDKKYSNKIEFVKHLKKVLEEKAQEYVTREELYEVVEGEAQKFGRVFKFRARVDTWKAIREANEGAEHWEEWERKRSIDSNRDYQAKLKDTEKEIKYIVSKGNSHAKKVSKDIVKKTGKNIESIINGDNGKEANTANKKGEKPHVSNYDKIKKERADAIKKRRQSSSRTAKRSKDSYASDMKAMADHARKHGDDLEEMMKILGATNEDINRIKTRAQERRERRDFRGERRREHRERDEK